MSIDFVAEIGSAHKGNKALAYELIRQAAYAGATTAKFQLGWTEATQVANGLVYNSIRYVDDWVGDLSNWCRDFGIEFMASVWSEAGIAAAKSVSMRRYKIAYSQRDNGQLLAKVFEQHRPVLISGGTWTELSMPIWCVSKYPAYPADLAGMPVRFGERWFGYSDHAHGIGACLLAVARGGRYIEKHFALDPTDLATKDTPFSATPVEFADMVKAGKEIARFYRED